MSKKTFKPFRLEDLTGGINIRDYASEIEDKQAIDVLNWNFEGNKLVSGKGKDVEINKGVGTLQGLAIDNGDIYYVKAGNVYKNGISLFLSNSYDITFTSVNGNVFTFGLDGVIKGYKFGPYGTEEEALTELLSTLQTDFPTYTISRLLNVFTIDKGGVDFIINKPQNQRRIQVSNWGVSSEVTITIDGVAYNGNGTTYTTSDDFIDYIVASLSTSTYFISTSGPTGSLDLVRKDGVIPVITSSSIDKYTYQATWLNSALFPGQLPDYTLNQIGGLDYKYFDLGISNYYNGYKAFDFIFSSTSNNLNDPSVGGSELNTTAFIGRSLTPKYPIKITEITRLPSNGATRAVIKQGTTILTTANFVSGTATFDYILIPGVTYTIGADANGASYTAYNHLLYNINNSYYYTDNPSPDNTFANIQSITVVSDFTSKYTHTSNRLTGDGQVSTINFYKSDYTQVTLGSQYLKLDDGGTTGLTSITESNIKATVTVSSSNIVVFNWINTGLGLNSDELFNITISSYGILLVGYILNSGATFIDWDGVSNTIGVGSVGTPTVGTIYNGKIILGGYIGIDGYPNDNIVFSKTATPTNISALTNFTGYDAGGQSVSGGNKGAITGFILGESGLYVFKDNEVWKTNTEKDTGTSFNFIFNKVTSTGAVNQRCITEVGQEIIYLDGINKCIRRLGYEVNMTTLRDNNISKEVKQYFKDIPDYNNLLINAGYKYPYYYVNINNSESPVIELSTFITLRVPNIQMVYNVDNKSWTERNEYNEVFNYALMSHKGYIGTDGAYIYKDFELNSDKEGEIFSKEYTFGDDIMYKKFGRFDIIGQIIPDDGESKVLTVEIWIDGEKVEEREYSVNQRTQIKEKIDLYDIGQKFQFKLKYSGLGKVEIYDVQIHYKGTTTQPQDYF